MARETIPLRERQPGHVEHLDQHRYMVGVEEGGIGDGLERAEIERACGARMRGQDLVHGRAKGLHHLWSKALEADHWLWFGLGGGIYIDLGFLIWFSTSPWLT